MKMSSFAFSTGAALAAPALVFALAAACYAQSARPVSVKEFPIAYPRNPDASVRGSCHVSGQMGSTHEITFDESRGGDLWITGQNYGSLVRVKPDGSVSFPRTRIPKDSGPHGIEFDASGLLWLTLEFQGRVVALDPDRPGEFARDYDVRLDCSSCPDKINTHPHGLGIGADGKTVWFTGKGTGTVGRITPDGEVRTFALPTVGSVPIYIKAGPDGNMWVTELVGNKIARVTPDGRVTEFDIPTHNSRPIAIVPGPDGNMWFTEEAGNKVGRVRLGGCTKDCVTEFEVRKKHPNAILAGLAFDKEGNLWVQQYVDHFNPCPAGRDHIVKIDKAILTAGPSGLSAKDFTFYLVPTRDTVMHRVIQGPDGNVWFTELNSDKVGRLAEGRGHHRRRKTGPAGRGRQNKAPR